MKDAFDKDIDVGSKVLYVRSGGAGLTYFIGEITKLYPMKDSKKYYNPPDRVAVKIISGKGLSEKKPILYASNVVRLPVEE